MLLGGITTEIVDATVYTNVPGTSCQVVNNVDNSQLVCLAMESPSRFYGWPYFNKDVIEGNLLSPSEKLSAESVKGTFQANVPLLGYSLPFSGFVGNWIVFSLVYIFILLILFKLINNQLSRNEY